MSKRGYVPAEEDKIQMRKLFEKAEDRAVISMPFGVFVVDKEKQTLILAYSVVVKNYEQLIGRRCTMTIKVRCRTNLDDWQTQEWPNEMAARPIIGDRVRAKSGKILKVVRVTHTTARIQGHELHGECEEYHRRSYPELEIELGRIV
jgi:hypothetical protein